MKPIVCALALAAWLSPLLAADANEAARDPDARPAAAEAVVAQAQTREAEEKRLQRELDAAREQLEAAAQEVARLSAEMSGGAMERVVRYFHETGRKAMLGITINDEPDKAGASAPGVRIYGVSPGGPADKAGLRAGDIIVAVDDRPMRADDRGPADRSLLTFMKTVEPGDAVRVRYSRDGQVAETTVVTEAFEPEAFRFSFKDGEQDLLDFAGEGDVRSFAFRYGDDDHHSRHATAAHLHLVPMSPGLGAYFGIGQGVLVVRADGDNAELQDGDVILSVDGVPAEDVGRVMKRLHSLGEGQSVALEIVRQRETLSVQLAGRAPMDADRRVIRRIEKRRIDPESAEVEIVIEAEED